MSKTTTYVLTVDGELATKTYTKKATAIAAADALVASREATTVEVATSHGTIVHNVARRRTGKRTPAGTRVVELPEDLKHLVPAGYVAAYARLRNTAVVLRNEDAPEPQRYLVIDTIAGARVGFAETTRQAGAIMKALGAEVRRAREAVTA